MATANPTTTASPHSGTGDGSNLLPSPASGVLMPVAVDSASIKKPGLMATLRHANSAPRKRRVKAPKDSKVYKAALATIALRAQGCSYEEIAEQLGLSKNSVLTYVKRANRKGWLNLHSFDDPDDRVEHVLKTQTTEVLHDILGERTQDGAPTDRAMEVSLEVAKGTGLLKQHAVVKNDGQAPTALALKVDVTLPPMDGAVPTIRPESIGGAPAIDGELADEEN